jgi:enhancing lycopene biosynthesis protein 2
MKKIGVLLSGCGVADGSEIHEAVLTLLAIREHGMKAVCMAPNAPQHHVTNHATDQPMDETRNMMVEAARIARGDIQDLALVKASDFDALVIPGGFGAATNLTDWAFSGPDGNILPDVSRIINEAVIAGKPIAALCMGPTVVALALKQAAMSAQLSVGTTDEGSPYDIGAISAGMNAAGQTAVMKNIREIAFDPDKKIISAPCYMMDADILDVRKNIAQAIEKLAELI